MKRLPRIAVMLENAFYECRFGVSTSGTYGYAAGDWSRREQIYYGTLSYRTIFCIIESLALKESDVLVDLGCGKGRVVCCAALYNLSSVIGVEVTEELCVTAERNLNQVLQKQAQATIIHGRAEEFDYTLGTVFYMFHPFGPNTMRAVLTQLRSGLRKRPRFVRIVYVNPKHDGVIEEVNWLERYERWPLQSSQCALEHPVSFWRVRSDAAELL